MGTNFYIRGHGHTDDPEWHIGKRSAAGMYCWDCRKTLHKGGEAGIHHGCTKTGHPPFCDCDWNKKCPGCGKAPAKEGLESSVGGRELGFNKSRPKVKSGVSSCSSFSWAMPADRLAEAIKGVLSCPCCGREYGDKDKVVENEYGDLFTWHEFLMVLEECPVQYTDSVGQEFS